MAIEFRLPDLGENIEAGEVLNVLVSAGQILSEDEPVIELETDKAVIEVPSSVAGKIVSVHVGKGDRAAVGQTILTLEPDIGETAKAPEASRPDPPAPAATDTTPSAVTPAAARPDVSRSDGSGDGGEADDGESSAAATEPPAPTAVGGPVARTAVSSSPASQVPAAPTVRRLAREIGVDITHVKGSGPGGRVSEDDVKAHAKALNEAAAGTAGGGIAVAPLPDLSKWGEVTREPFSNVRRLTAAHMANAWSTSPHVTQFDKADVTQLEVWRKAWAGKAEKAGGKLTPTAIILKVVAAALGKFPQFNASIDMARSEVVYKKYRHIGIAVDTPRGLLVPVVRDVNTKNAIELSVELSGLAERTRTGKIAIEEMQGGCFTISNLGGIGGTNFTPIVNAPEAAILGVARSQQEPVLVDGEFQPRLMMPLSLSYDHRLIDGADGARFLRWICEALENPFLILLEG